MPRIRLIHWHAAEAAERAARLARGGLEVEHAPLDPSGLRALRADPPDAVVIDLSRLPSHGRDLGAALRQTKATRGVPLVFVGGDSVKGRPRSQAAARRRLHRVGGDSRSLGARHGVSALGSGGA